MSEVIEMLVQVAKDDFHWTTMGEISNVIGGGTPRTSDPQNFEGGDIPWITPADLSGYTEKFIAGGNRRITSKGLESSAARMLPTGAVLFTSRAPIGYVAIAKNPIATNQGFKSFVLKEGVLPEYVYWWLKGSKQKAESYASGTTFLELSGANAKKLPIPMVSLARQREIVAEIEKQFSRLDDAVANLQRVKANLKRYKASVLKDAVEGRLVPSEVIASDGERNPVWVPISNAIRNLDQGWSPQCESESRSSSDEWAVIKTTAIQSMEFRAEENKLLPPGLVSRAHLSLMSGDLLITRAGPRTRVGVTCLVKSDFPKLMICDKAYRLRAKLDVAIPAYLEVVLSSPTLLDGLDELKSGISDSGLNLTQKRFGELLVPLPSLAVQRCIVDEVDRRLSFVRGVEAEVDASLERAQALRQSTLAKVFSEGQI